MVRLHSITEEFFQFISENGSLIGVNKEEYPTEILALEEANKYFQE